MMMSIAQGKYYSVGDTANRIWELIEQPTPLREVVSALVSEFDVSEDVCSDQVRHFVGELIANGLAVEHQGARPN